MAFVPQDLLDRINALERQVRQLQGRANIRPALNQILNGDVRIGEGGQLYVTAPGGQQVVKIGKLYPDRDEFGTIIRRQDGSLAFGVFNGSQTDPDGPQAIRILTASGDEIFSEDVETGGLARPYLSYPAAVPADIATWPATDSTSWTTLSRVNGLAQHPRVQVYASIGSAGADGQLRITANGSTLATGATGANITGAYALPSFTFGAEITFELQARRTGGTGSIYGALRYLYGVQS